MYAIISTGGKQYRVREGDRLHIERVDGEVGEEVAFDQVLLIGDDGEIQPGSPFLKDARVTGRILDQGKGDKVIVFKFKRRKMYRRKTGHRQLETQIRIESIAAKGGPKAASEAKPSAEEKQPKAPPAKAKGKKTARKATSSEKAASAKKKSATGRTGAKKKSGPAAKKKAASSGGKTSTKKSPKASSAKKPAKAAKKPSAKKPSKE